MTHIVSTVKAWCSLFVKKWSHKTHKPLEYAVGLANERGFEPICKPVPHIEPSLVVLGLSVEGKLVPLMVKVEESRAKKGRIAIADPK